MCPNLNLNLHLMIWFRHLPNTNTNKRFGFNMFGSGLNLVRHKKSQLYLQISNTVGQKMLVKRFPTHQLQNQDLSPSKPHLQPEVDHHRMLTSNIAIPQISHSPFDDDDNHLSMLTLDCLRAGPELAGPARPSRAKGRRTSAWPGPGPHVC